MVKEDVRLRRIAVKKHLEQRSRAAAVRDLFGKRFRTLKRGCHNSREEGVAGLRRQSSSPHRSPTWIYGSRVRPILELRPHNPAWGSLRIHTLLARRGARVSRKTVHRVFKRHWFIGRVVREPLPFKRSLRRLVDSL